MFADRMSGELPPQIGQNENIQAVTSVGNSWIICRSKSHTGRIYYFNTLTGEAAWNLSDSEIEKAQKRTKILESQSGTDLESCPEPKEPPVDSTDHVCNKSIHPNTQVCLPAKVYNKQIINNKFSKQPYSFPFTNSQCCHSVDSTLELNTPNSFNTNIWAIPQHHHLVIAPSVTPIVSHTQSSNSLAYNNLEQTVTVQNTSLPLSSRFNFQRNDRFNRGIKKFAPRNYNNRFRQRQVYTPIHKSEYNQANPKDLRQVISAKRSSDWYKSSHKDHEAEASYTNIANASDDNLQNIQIISPSTEDLFPIDEDDVWLKEHASVQGSQLKLNITPLKSIIATTSNANHWFVIADVNVLLNHYNFINIIVNSDEQCQLMVPENTMAELQASSRSSDVKVMSRAHLVLRLISQQFVLGRAVMGKDPSSDSNIFEFTLKLRRQNFDVALVSNDFTLKKNKDHIAIFSIEDIKNILESKVIKPNPVVQSSEPKSECSIKITISNNVDFEELQPNSRLRNISEGKESDTKSTSTEDIPHKINKEIEIQTISLSKSTTDTGVQTDLVASRAINFTFDSAIENRNNINLTNTAQINFTDVMNTTQNDNNSNEVPKKREIRLKRNVSQQPNNNGEMNTEKKQFKWRRRKRNISPIRVPDSEQPKSNDSVATVITNDKQYVSNSTQCVEDNSFNTEYIFGEHTNEEKNDDIRFYSYEDNMNSSETSSCLYSPLNIDQKIIIEETSTSGIISNSTSNMDSNSLQNVNQNAHTKDNDTSTIKCVMFEVESPAMEECLKTKSDEWVSRFVQIMEEVLSLILQQDPPFFDQIMPPPWTLHEAAECIKKKFNNDSDVVDASNKLTNSLYKLSDSRGRIVKEINPAKFMEMYSYGVYLVDALQAVVSNTEDLEVAADLLAKLLNDIEDTNMDVGQNELFIDNINDPSANVTQCSNSNANNDTNFGLIMNMYNDEFHPVKDQTISKEDTKKYNLRSNKKRIESEQNSEKVEDVKFIRKIDIESTFFATLNLKRRNKNHDDIDKVNNAFETDITNQVTENNATCPKPNSGDSAELEEKADDVNVPVTSEPKIIRNFSMCLEFEKKIKDKQHVLLDMENFDYPENEDEYDYDDGEYYTDYYYPDNQSERIDILETSDSNIEYEINSPENLTDDQNGNNTFECVISRIVKEIRQTFVQVHTFCDKTREELESTCEIGSPRKNEIQEQAGKARIHMDNLCRSLKSILDREGKCTSNIQTILQKAGIHLDANKSTAYRNIISKCSDQAHNLLESVDILIEAVK